MKYQYDKLVRDNIVRKIEERGAKVAYRILSDEEYEKELDKKLREETEEYIIDHSIEEMADVMEVIYAILKNKGITMQEVEEARILKKNKKGGFEEKIYLQEVEEDR